jgi:hypothetical protein
MMYREYCVPELIDKIVDMESGDKLDFCERYAEEDIQNTAFHESWYGVNATVMADNHVVVIGKYGMGDVGIADLGSEFVREDLVRYFGNLGYEESDKLLIEEAA